MYAASLGDQHFVARALRLQVGRVAVQDVRVFGIDVDVREKVRQHVIVVALHVISRQSYKTTT